jgi:hypothetical protein
MTPPQASSRRFVPGGLLEGPRFGLRKTWVDPVPGIEMVQVHYACSAVGQDPDWDDAESMVLMPDAGPPGSRSAVIDVPRSLPGASEYALHHFFFVVHGTERTTTPVVTEVVAPHDVVYEDRDGTYTHVGLVWAVQSPGDVQDPTNYTTASLDGLDFAPDEDRAGGTDTAAPLFDFVRSRPLPHVFRGQVFAPRGFGVEYLFHLVRSGSPDPAADVEVWDDNGGQRWRVDL